MFKRILNIIKTNKRTIIFMFSMICFIILARQIHHNEFLSIDTKVYSIVHKYLIKDSFTPIAKFVTFFGSAICFILLTIILVIVLKNKKMKMFIPLNVISIGVFNLILKNIFQRPRPIDFRIIDETGYSFPSGHSMVSLAFYGFLIYLVYKNINNNFVKWTLIIIMLILIFLIGLSRIYLGVHYFSDVIAGFMISIAYLTIVTTVYKKY